MNYHDAQNLLDRVRAGENTPQRLIDQALELTGDLDGFAPLLSPSTMEPSGISEYVVFS